MKKIILSTLAWAVPLLTQAQSTQPKNTFGFALNTSMNGEITQPRVTPSIAFYSGKSKIEVGVGFHPSINSGQKILSIESNYKYFPNGMANKFNMYLVTRSAFVMRKSATYNPTTYKYFLLNGGYGFEINAYKGMYIGTNISLGGFTYHKTTENPYPHVSRKKMFDDVGINLAFQCSVGYRL